jgi:hypothetical protein
MATTYRPTPRAQPLGGAGMTRSDYMPVYLAVVLGYMLFLPPQLTVRIGDIAIPPYRFLLIPATLFLMVTSLRGRWRFNWLDLLVILGAFWICLALFMTTEAYEAFTAVVAQTTDMALAYFFARAAFQTPRDFRVFLLMMAPGVGLVGGTLMLESLTETHIIQPLFSTLTGQGFATPRMDERLGLMRARGPFPHPILAGIFLASFLSLYFMSGLRGWPRVVGIIGAVASFFTVSSAALLALTVGVVLMSYNWLSQHIVNLTWRFFFVMFGILIFVTELGTNSGAYSLIVRYASLNSISSYNRVLIWKYGTKNVEKNPWFGLGYAEWERPVWMKVSFDHFWLLTAVRFGLIPSVLYAVVTAAAVILLARRSASSNPADAMLERGIAIALAVYALGVISVALWLSAQVWFFVLIGLAVSLGTRRLGPGGAHRPMAGPAPLRRPVGALPSGPELPR